jgi:hypothetical protein
VTREQPVEFKRILKFEQVVPAGKLRKTGRTAMIEEER